MKQLRTLKAISQDEKALLKRCANFIKRLDPSAEVILYGSRARGEAEPESDYDLLILTDGDVDIEREDLFRRQLFPIEIETGCVFTVILFSRRDWNTPLYRVMPFYQNVEKDGVLL